MISAEEAFCFRSMQDMRLCAEPGMDTVYCAEYAPDHSTAGKVVEQDDNGG